MDHHRIAGILVALFCLWSCACNRAAHVEPAGDEPKKIHQADHASTAHETGEAPRFTRLEYINRESSQGPTPKFTIESDGKFSIQGIKTGRDQLSPAELAKLNTLFAAVDWAGIENDPTTARQAALGATEHHYQPGGIADAVDVELTAIAGRKSILASVKMVGMAGEPWALSELLRYLEILRRQLDKATRSASTELKTALIWLARHQSAGGNWNFTDYQKACKDKSCTGPGGEDSYSAATALALQPFLAGNQSSTSRGPFQQTVARGVEWLIAHQNPNGDLSAGARQQMFSHGLAMWALCEDFLMTGDKTIGKAAQKGVDFIEATQNPKTGGWAGRPGEKEETRILGWQIIALRDAERSGLNVHPETMEGARKWLHSVSTSGADGAPDGFSNMPGGPRTPVDSAVGLICSQYLHTKRGDPLIVGCVRYLLANMPDEKHRDVQYLFLGQVAMHGMMDRNWDTWNRQVRKPLFASQVQEGCAAGSWNPDEPVRDAWSAEGGRLMITCFSAMTLEATARWWLPQPYLYRLNHDDEPAEAAKKEDGSVKPSTQ